MKKIILLIICLFIFTVCTNLQNDNLDNIVSEIQKSKINIKKSICCNSDAIEKGLYSFFRDYMSLYKSIQ